MESEIKNCQNCKKEFEIDSEDFKFYEKIKVPPPTFCHNCRLSRKLAWRNERTLHKRVCDLCNKNIISMHKPNVVFPVYCHDCWWSDEWDPTSYGKDFNFSKSFFEQFNELQKIVPRPSDYSTANINSEYCNHTAHMKNSYLIFGAWFSEDCGYGQTIIDSKNCWDSIFMRRCEFCFFSSDCIDCNQIFFSRQCTACIDSYFIFDCRNCQNSIFSYNLRNKNYHIFNEPVSKEEFHKIRKEIFSSRESLKKAQDKFEKIIKEKAIHKFMIGDQNYNVSGEFISKSKNVHSSYYVDKGENEKYAVRSGIGQKDTMDVFGTHSGELCYECNNIDFSSRCLFGVNGENNMNSSYVVDCDHLNNSFGCISVRKNEYCILNKKYTKEEYQELVSKIIEQMNNNPYKDSRGVLYKYGEFFPGELSPFFYNETIAQEYFQLNETEVKKLGYLWNENVEEKAYVPTLSWKDLPETIDNVDDSVLDKILVCEDCDKNFRITKGELDFYKRMHLPLPHKDFECRHKDRMAKRNPRKLWHRKCMKEGCENEFETSYAPDRLEKVYCESCYNKEVY